MGNQCCPPPDYIKQDYCQETGNTYLDNLRCMSAWYNKINDYVGCPKYKEEWNEDNSIVLQTTINGLISQLEMNKIFTPTNKEKYAKEMQEFLEEYNKLMAKWDNDKRREASRKSHEPHMCTLKLQF